ncbi:helix-turn-helix domain-containing protein [Streptomyces shenzhenensis]|uniref:helix-turn-helix domain-containing protein n=1 Tax=Streptomyces shenzhenensis TaxID=943815 RepID=UPI003F541FD7
MRPPRLRVHRSVLRYRLQRILEITDRDPANVGQPARDDLACPNLMKEAGLTL